MWSSIPKNKIYDPTIECKMLAALSFYLAIRILNAIHSDENVRPAEVESVETLTEFPYTITGYRIRER